MKRCFGDEDPLYAQYHDEEWGVAVHNDQKLFEMLILEGAQAGLSWITVLKRRENYRKLFHNFDPQKVAAMSDDELEDILQDPGVIRNRLKIFSVRTNARIFIKIQEEFGSFDSYLWSKTPDPLVGKWKNKEEVPTSSLLSDAISKDLKKRGMSFVGSTIIYAYMQAVGVVNDHLLTCHKSQDYIRIG